MESENCEQPQRPQTFEAFTATKQWVDNIGDILGEELNDMAGYVYADSFWIESCEMHFSTIVGNQEYASQDLNEAERWLWDNWAKGELFDPEATPGFKDAVRSAQEAFWARIVIAYPDAKTGDFPPEAQMAFDEACTNATRTWLHYNLEQRTN